MASGLAIEPKVTLYYIEWVQPLFPLAHSLRDPVCLTQQALMTLIHLLLRAEVTRVSLAQCRPSLLDLQLLTRQLLRDGLSCELG